MIMKKYVYLFGKEFSEGNRDMRNLLGGKGCNLAEMSTIGVPVPPGFTITTDVCTYFYQNNQTYPRELERQVHEGLRRVEDILDKKFGDTKNPLLLSVRSGARVSMPGMMDTILNLGLNDETVMALTKVTNNPRFAWDSYRRFIQMYSNVVMGMDGEILEHILEEKKKSLHIRYDYELSEIVLQELVHEFKKKVQAKIGQAFPTDPKEQLWNAIGAVFKSWDIPRARTYRKLNNIPEDWGTAVNVQSMVFGNLGETSATGVAFTRDPSTGENLFYGEYLINAQGEDVVAGIRTPHPINKARKKSGDALSLEETMPKLYKELEGIYNKLEKHYREMQDLEFTIEMGKLWLLQTRTGKRTARAAVRIAIDMEREGLISKEEALLRVDPYQLDQLLHPMLDPKAKYTALATGLPASPGAVTGKVVFTADEAESLVHDGEKVILVRIETSPEDIHGMHAAEGILTSRGGMTSHAAVVARGMGKCCIVGCGVLEIDYTKEQFRVGETVIRKGDFITLDGGRGIVVIGKVPTVKPKLDEYFQTLMSWADKIRTMKVRTNADTPHDAKVARDFGAEGIGLCRTEHMFFDEARIQAVREMIFADNSGARREALDKILPMQKGDFLGILKEMQDLPVTIRLLDPPLHEFLPREDMEIEDFSKKSGITVAQVKTKLSHLTEFNPMLGHRGCRLGVTYPEIYDVQVQAIMEAACELTKAGTHVIPEIMIPLVGMYQELEILRASTIRIADDVCKKYKVKVPYTVGTMIELPRAVVTADEIAEYADFFSFGTNDLTQTTYGFSRDDAGKFLPAYVDKKILPEDPFVSMDLKGVGELVRLGVMKGRGRKKNLKIGICGEHGGDPKTIFFLQKLGLDYVSCSPYRVPIARLSAAQAVLQKQ